MKKKFKGITTILDNVVIDTYDNINNILVPNDGWGYYATGVIYSDEYRDYLKWEKNNKKDDEEEYWMSEMELVKYENTDIKDVRLRHNNIVKFFILKHFRQSAYLA